MCGIAGFLRRGGLAEDGALDILAGMTSAIRHRGPDDVGAWVDGTSGIALGHRRLSILDLSPLGHQPMHSADHRYTMVYNGEIYNFRALRRDLEARGHRFRGHSDTEVLLAAVAEWGVRGALERVNGMFALALWDRDDRALHLTRDRAGEKPLYYRCAEDGVVFGSELKALRAFPGFRATLDRGALALFLRNGYVPGPYTIYEGVRKLPPGTLLTLRAGAEAGSPVPYWSAREVAERGVAEPFSGTPDEAVDILDALLRDAVRIRMESDVPLGAFLSGGIDSSTIVALMQAQSSRPVRTFTIGFHEQRYDEAQHAAAVARHLGTDHTELRVAPEDALAVIPRLPHMYDEPFADASQIPTFLVSELTRRHVTVSLSGDAGDELFGGYTRYATGPRLWRTIGAIPASARRLGAALLSRPVTHGAVVRAAQPLLRRWTGKRSASERLRQVGELLGAESIPSLYQYMMSYWKTPTEAVPGASEPVVPATDPLAWARVGGTAAQQMMYLDFLTFLPDDILVKVDRASMAVSLEARVPLLDHRVIELAWRMPLELKMRDGAGKWPLRRVLDRYVPRQLVERPKMGFGVPMAAWLRGPLREWAEELLDERRMRLAGWLDPAPIRRRWREHVSGVTSWDHDLWTVLMFQAWLESAEDSIAAVVPLRGAVANDPFSPRAREVAAHA